jgi:hypothetical protein
LQGSCPTTPLEQHLEKRAQPLNKTVSVQRCKQDAPGTPLCGSGIEQSTNDTGISPLCEGKVAYNPDELAGLAFLISQGLLVEVVDRVPLVFE